MAAGLGPGPGDRDPFPHGGPKITWGGPPVDVRRGKNRLHFDLAPTAGSDQQTEVDRLESLGARRIDIGQGDVDRVVMADPDGSEFCLLPSTERPAAGQVGKAATATS
ncbi:VOC family protein [Blastococcus brunescens]|uniref:VOC family protein n=1 Tax=Blastococcus brunescens TaxID=1564165 RepID=A0ABZ1ATG8_9ACTN|nr:VOC family protein [Blastococcus sp. BMG 8361]WRL61873.1 VOC family protein [Blastococcus sp. BMG 8361]